MLVALALIAVASVSCVTDGDTEVVVPLPVNDEHFMDYVTTLIDEFAPDKAAVKAAETKAADDKAKAKEAEAKAADDKAKATAAKDKAKEDAKASKEKTEAADAKAAET